MNLEHPIKVLEQLTLKISAHVCKNLKESTGLSKKLVDCCPGRVLCRLRWERDAFYPLGELVHHHEYILITPSSFEQRAQKVEMHLLHG